VGKQTKYVSRLPDASGRIDYTAEENAIWAELFARQKQAIRGKADPNEAIRFGGRSQAADLTQCADKALAIAGNDKLKDMAPDFLKGCLAEAKPAGNDQGGGKGQGQQAEKKRTAAPGEVPPATPRVPVTRTALSQQ